LTSLLRISIKDRESGLRSSFFGYLWEAFLSRCGACRVCRRVSKLAFFPWVRFGLCIWEVGLTWRRRWFGWWLLEWNEKVIEVHGGMYSGDACWWNRNNCGCFFYFMPWMNVQAKRKEKKKHTWCLVFSFSVCFLLFSLLNILSRSLFCHQNDPCPPFFFFLWLIYLLSFFSPYFNWYILFKMSVVQF